MSTEPRQPHLSHLRYRPDLNDLRMVQVCKGNHAAAYRRLIAESWTKPYPSYSTFVRRVRELAKPASGLERPAAGPHRAGQPAMLPVVPRRRRPSAFAASGARRDVEAMAELLLSRAAKAAS